MFTGIIETLGKVTAIDADGSNIHFTVESSIGAELKIDQSVAHNGVCLTVVAVSTKSAQGNSHRRNASKNKLR
jgi:riboflavin synthase